MMILFPMHLFGVYTGVLYDLPGFLEMGVPMYKTLELKILALPGFHGTGNQPCSLISYPHPSLRGKVYRDEVLPCTIHAASGNHCCP